MKIKAKIGIIVLNILVLFVPVFSFAQSVTLTPPGQVDNSNPLSPTNKVTSIDLTNPNNAQMILQGTSQSDPTVQSASQASFHITPDCYTKNNGVAECGWSDLVILAKKLMVYMIFIGTTLAAISVAYAGFMYATSAGNSGKIEKAHQVFTTVAVGLLFLWGGWLLVATIMKTLGVNDAFSLVNNSSVVPVNSTTTK